MGLTLNLGAGDGPVRLDSIAITKAPDKTSYLVGEQFSTSGMVVTATYTSGTTAQATGYLYSPDGDLTTDVTSITITYTENGITKTAVQAIQVKEYTKISEEPKQSGTLTYTGSAQPPSWTGYDSDALTIGGTTTGTNAGSYTATFTPNYGYIWSDGSSAARSVTWTIGKAAGSMSLSKTSVSLSEDSLTDTITITRDGSGAISASSNATSVATVAVSDTTITVTGQAAGTATITVSVGADTNHTAPDSQTITVKVSFLTANATATSGVTYTEGISGITQAKLSSYAKAISNNSAIKKTTSTVYIDDEDNHYKISVGDTISITVSSASYVFQIIGFNHDTLASATAYGTTTATGKAGISFQMVGYLATRYSADDLSTTTNSWDIWPLRTTLQGTIKDTIASAWTDVIKNVSKQTSAGSQSTTIETTSDDLFLLSEVEVFGTTTYSASGEGSQYAYYKAGNSKIKTVNGSAYAWWERSPDVNNSSSDYFCCVSTKGSASRSTFATSGVKRGVAFGFCV